MWIYSKNRQTGDKLDSPGMRYADENIWLMLRVMVELYWGISADNQ